MYLLKRGIDAVSSATTSTRTRLVQLEAKASATQTDLNKQQAIATEMIKIAPTSLKGYLLAGRTHLKQKNYEVALAVYKQGLELVPNIVPSYSLLQRNYDAVQAELMKRQKLQRLPSSARNHHQQQQKHQDAINQQHLDTVSSTFAYDIISLIFSHLSVHDLIKCTSVCDSWRRFIIKWPVFWQLITAEIPQLDLNSFTMYLTNRHRGLKFLEQQHPHTHRQKVISRNALSLLVALQSFRYPLESLLIENMIIDSDSSFLLSALQPHSLNSLELYNVQLSSDSLLGSIVLACHEADRIIFKAADSTIAEINDSNQYFLRTEEKQQQQNISFNNDGSSNLSLVIDYNRESSVFGTREFNRFADTLTFELTYLKISLGGRSPTTTPFIHSDGELLNEIIRRCPKLQHLFLDSRDAVCHGQLMLTVSDRCPWITNFVLSDSCTMPKTVKTSDIDSESNNSTSTVSTHGLCQFVMAGSGSYNATSEQVHTLLHKHQSTIKLLFLHYDGYVITSELLCRLAYHGQLFPQLRELWIYTHQQSTASDCISSTSTTPAFTYALSTFLLRCPALQALTIIDRSPSPTTPLVTDPVLQSLANQCTNLEYLRVHSCRSFTTQGLSQLASAAGVVKTLDLNFMHRDLLPVISQWRTLKHVVLRTNAQHTMNQTDLAVHRLVEAGLHRRDGTFQRKDY